MNTPQPIPATTGRPASPVSSVALTAALSLLAGVTDVTSWLLLGGFFSAHVTGNLVVIAADIVSGRSAGIAALLAIPVFALTAAAATVISRRLGLRGASSRGITTILLGAQTALLILAAALSFGTRASHDPTQPLAVVIGLCAVCAMATQNAFLHLVPPKAASTAVMTGNLVAGTIALVDLILSRGASSSARTRWHEAWPLLAGFVGGCLIGAAGAVAFSDRASLTPAVLSCILFVVVVSRHSTSAGRIRTTEQPPKEGQS
jgi:uncharacterized membrane protein YoaK (UPF0700 family)